MYIPFITNLLGLTGLPDNAGWFAYPPLRSMLNTSGTDFAIMSIWVLGVASLTGGGINFFVTIINERKPELGWFDLPIWIWTVMFTNLLAIYSIPWLLDAWSMVWLERNLGMAFFNARMGGDPPVPVDMVDVRPPRSVRVSVARNEGVIESVTHEDAGCWNCVYERQHPAARGDFYRRVLQCNGGDRDARVVRAS